MNDLTRRSVRSDFSQREAHHARLFAKKKVETECYIYKNQYEDAAQIVALYKQGFRVVSVKKRTKVGMDGLMLAVAFLMCTDEDDAFMVEPEKVRILTGMSNVAWETDMKQKSPECFSQCIFHHGKLKIADLNSIGSNAFMIIDEIDTGSAKESKLDKTLIESGILNCANMQANNHRFLFASATLMRELDELHQWGALHANFTMQIPPDYIGHGDFLRLGLIQEYYPLLTEEACLRWLDEDVLAYGDDFRAHIARVKSGDDGMAVLTRACAARRIKVLQHTSETNGKKQNKEDGKLAKLFGSRITEHVVVVVKGLFRRANLIPNSWKMKIGAVHELCTNDADTSVQVQGLPGRVSGYWRKQIEAGHRIGPIRTSIAAIQEYEVAYATFGAPYHGGRRDSMLETTHVGLAAEAVAPVFQRVISVFPTKEENDAYAASIGNKEAAVFDKDGAFWRCKLPVIDRLTTLEMAELGFSGEKKVQTVLDLHRYMAKQTVTGIAHSRDSSIHTIQVGEFRSRKYVGYTNPADPATAEFYTLAFRRTE